MKKTVKGLMALILLLFSTATVTGLNVSIVDESNTLSSLDYDRTTPNGFFGSFPEDFERPEVIGSNSFTDNSLVSPNILLSYESESDLSEEEMNVYYKSFSGSLERSVSTQAINLTGKNGEKEIEISAFEALYPGKLYGSTSTQTVEIEGGLLNGSYLVSTDTSQRDSKTTLTVEEAYNSRGEQIHRGLDLSEDLLVSIVSNGSAVAEREMSLYGSKDFDTVLEGNETIYVNNLSALEIRKASPCTTLDISNSYYVIDSSIFNANPEDPGGGDKSCLNIRGEDITVDFGDNVLDGDGNYSNTEACGVRIKNSENIQINKLNVQQFSRGLCIENSSEVIVNGTSIQENRMGVYSNDSKASLSNVTSSNEFEEYTGLEGSTVDLINFSFDSARATIKGKNISVDDSTFSEDPNGLENTGNILDITSNGDSILENISFYYSEEPDLLYSPTNDQRLESGKTVNRIFLTESIEAPSLIGTYIEAEQDEEQPGDGSGGGGGGGSGGGGGGGGGGALPPGLGSGDPPDNATDPGRPPWVPANLAPEKVPRVNLSANETISVQQGKSFELPFRIDSVGNVSAVDISVNTSTPEGWRSTETFFDEILPGESSNGKLFVDVFKAELLKSYEIRLEASTVINGTFVSLDNETVDVLIEPREDVRDIHILEGPFQMNITEGTAQTESFELRNSGDYRLENVSVRTVGLEKCINDVRGAWSFNEGVEEEFNYTFMASDTSDRCDGSLIFYSGSEDLLGVVPAQINVLDVGIRGLSNYLLPWLVLIWTLFTVHRIWRWKHERKRR